MAEGWDWTAYAGAFRCGPRFLPGRDSETLGRCPFLRNRTGYENAATWGVPCVTALFVMVAEFRRPSAGAVPRCAALLCLTRVVLLSVGGALRRSDSSPALLCGAGRFLCRELAPAQVSGHGQRRVEGVESRGEGDSLVEIQPCLLYTSPSPRDA